MTRDDLEQLRDEVARDHGQDYQLADLATITGGREE